MVFLVAEIWKDIKGYEGSYQVSNLSRVKSLDRIVKRSNGQMVNIKSKILKTQKTSRGCPCIYLKGSKKRKRESIHDLMAHAFLPNPKNKIKARHVDGNKMNNTLKNIQWEADEIHIENEKWGYVEGYEDLYQVSNFGRIRTLSRLVKRSPSNGSYVKREQITESKSSQDGYYRIRLRRDSKWITRGVHNLVAIAFIPNFENKPFVNHKDGNKRNNHVDNLEWCDGSYNIIHAYEFGLNANSKRIELTEKNNGVISYQRSMAAASRYIGEDIDYISRKTKSGIMESKRYRWEVIDEERYKNIKRREWEV